MNQPSSPETAHERLGALIDKILKEVPGITVLVSEIVPSGNHNTMNRIWDYNSQVAVEVTERRTRGQHVWLALMPIRTSNFADDLHPNDDGYRAMAHGWDKAIKEVNELGWISNPVNPGDQCSAKSLAERGEAANGPQVYNLPSWIEQGKVASGAGLGQDLYNGTRCWIMYVYPSPPPFPFCYFFFFEYHHLPPRVWSMLRDSPTSRPFM